MQQPLNYAPPSMGGRRAAPWRVVLLCFAVVAIAFILVFAGIGFWYEREMTRNRVILSVTNHATTTLYARFNSPFELSGVLVSNLAPSKSDRREKDTFVVQLSGAELEVSVGGKRFVGTLGSALDDDGPHYVDVDAFDDRVTATHSLNIGTRKIEMRPIDPATQSRD